MVYGLSSFSVVSVATSTGLPTTTDAVQRDGRQNKKSKWDKVIISLFIVYISMRIPSYKWHSLAVVLIILLSFRLMVM